MDDFGNQIDVSKISYSSLQQRMRWLADGSGYKHEFEDRTLKSWGLI